MGILDKIFLLLTGLIAAYLVFFFYKKNSEKNCSCNLYFILSFLVLLVAGLILIFSGWSALGSKFVSIVAGLIPFGIALGLISKLYSSNEKLYLIVLTLGLILIAVTKFVDMGVLGKIIYPLFHGIAGLTIFFVPILKLKQGETDNMFLFVTLGGTLIGLGGIALAFISVGKQLLFFSPSFVLTILAPLLFLTTLSYAIGFIKGKY